MLENELKWQKTKGSNVWIDNKKYIDFTSSIFTQNFGHNNSYVVKAVDKQLDKCLHAYGYNTEIKEKYLKRLKEFTGYNNILLFSTGSEATEAVIKICTNNGYECAGIKTAMHGRTLGSEALVGKRSAENIKSYDEIPRLSSTENNIAFFIEGYRGYDCKLLSNLDIEKLVTLKSNGNIIVFDEIQSGFYRTNKKFIYLNYGIKPDILLIAKSMGGGFPLSAVCYNKDFNLEGIELTSTHSGQPLQMAAGYGILEYINNEFDIGLYSDNKYIMQAYFHNMKSEHNNLGMVGAFKCDNEHELYNLCLDDGLLIVRTWKGWIKIAPPVNIKTKELIKGLKILRQYVN